VRERLRHLPPPERPLVQHWQPAKLGHLLMRQLGLPSRLVDTALAEQRRIHQPLGRTLLQLGLIRPEDLLKALSLQAGVRYLASVDPAVVAHRHAELARDAMRALRLVPVATDPRRHVLQVACTAPVPVAAIRALGKMMDCNVEPLLVTDDVLPKLVDVYAGLDNPDNTPVGAVCDARTGPAFVARLARAHRMVRLLHERCDPYVWVRLQSERIRADVLMPAVEAERM